MSFKLAKLHKELYTKENGLKRADKLYDDYDEIQIKFKISASIKLLKLLKQMEIGDINTLYNINKEFPSNYIFDYGLFSELTIQTRNILFRYEGET